MRILMPIWTNRSLASDLFDEMDRFYDEWNLVTKSEKIYDERRFDPAYEISETDEHYLMSVDLPGMKKENIKIEISDNILTLSGERKREGSENNQWIQRYEKSYGFFKRGFTLPSSIESKKVEARYENGVLELYLPKTEAAKPRNIEIQTGKNGIFEKLLGVSKKTSQELKEASSAIVS